ncbi:hypothetical protein ACFFG2_18610, partial [Paraburkholderia solisilvae]
MKTTHVITHCNLSGRHAMSIVLGAAVWVAAAHIARAEEVIPQWVVVADAALPASSVSVAGQPGRGESGAPGEPVATGQSAADQTTVTAADDAAAVFTPDSCIGNQNNCGPYARGGARGGSGAAGAASSGGSGSSGN